MSVAAATGTILDRILDTKRTEIAALRARVKIADLMAQCADLPPTRGFRAALAEAPIPRPLPPMLGAGGEGEPVITPSPLSEDRLDSRDSPSPPAPSIGGRGRGMGAKPAFTLIAEVKKASPSKGVIRADFDPVSIARAYHVGGAACLSVLTDETYFQGNLAYLAAIRAAVPMPLLRKDFLIDPIQVYEARVAGADAILLIVAAIPSPARLAELRIAAQSIGLDVLVEVHDRAELDLAVESGANLIGVNNRDLRTFELRLETAETLIPLFPPGVVAVAESGIFTHADAARLARAGAQAMLVGESLMRAIDIAGATRELLTGAPLHPSPMP